LFSRSRDRPGKLATWKFLTVLLHPTCGKQVFERPFYELL
jgi:hypothetical protein